MRRRGFVVASGATMLSLVLSPSGAQPSLRHVRIGYLAPTRIPHLVEALTGGLRDLGYVEEQNLSIEYRFAGEEPQRFDQLATELVKLAPDVIVTVATPATLAAKRATSSIPIVVATAGGPRAQRCRPEPREAGRKRDRSDPLLGRIEPKATGGSQRG